MIPTQMSHPKTRKTVPMDAAMYELRVKLLPVFGFLIRPCTLGPNTRTGQHRMCIEKDNLDSTVPWSGEPCSTHHAVHDPYGLAMFPDEVQAAAHAIDKSKPAKVQP
jgi:hypothetical protein